MIARFVEVTDLVAYGKFLVCRMTPVELATPTAMPEARLLVPDAAPSPPLLTYGGRRRFNSHSTLVVDLQRGTAAAWPLQGVAEAYKAEHLQNLPVCPMYMPFIEWLYRDARWAMGAGDITDIPAYIELPTMSRIGVDSLL